MRNFTDGFRQPKKGLWALEWVNFRSPVPDAPRLNIPWKWLGIAAAFTVLGFLLPWEWAASYFLPVFGMAQLAINPGAIANDHTGTRWRQAWQNTQDNFTDLYSLQSRIISAGEKRFIYDPVTNPGGATTTEGRIALADAQCVLELATILFIPAFMLPYDITQCPATVSVQRVREGGSFDVYDCKAYGAIGGGNDWASCNAAVLGAIAAKGTCYFPPGFYQLSNSLSFNAITDVQFVGGGGNSSSLVQNANGIFCLEFTGACSRVLVRDLWLGSFISWTTGGSIRIVGDAGTFANGVNLENITVQNTPTPIVVEKYGIGHFSHVLAINSIAGAVKGVVASFQQAVNLTVDDLICYSTAGLFPSDVVQVNQDCDTFILINSTILSGTGHGIRCQNLTGDTGPRLTRFTNVFSESNLLSGFMFDEGFDVRLNGCHADVNGEHGFHVSGGSKSITMTDCRAANNGQHGFYVTTTSTGTKIDGCVASNNSQTTNGIYSGIYIAVNVTHVRVTNNRSGDFLYGSVNKQRNGLFLGSGVSDFLYVGGNDLQGNLGLGFEFPIDNQSLGVNNQYYGTRQIAASEAALVAGLDTISAASVHITVTLTAARVVGALLSKCKGQRAVFTFIQNGTGGWAVTWNAVYKHSWVDTGNTASKRSSIAFVYDGTNWNQDAAQSPYV